MSAATASSIPSTHLLIANTYLGPMIASKATIEREAHEAAQQGQSLNDACPYPFVQAAGEYFKQIYEQALANTQNVREQQT